MNRRIPLLTLLLASAPCALGQSYTWVGGGADGLWSTGGNWAGGGAPVSGANTNLTFQGAAFSATNNVAFPFNAASLTFGSLPGSFSTAGNSISISNAGSISQNSSGTVTVLNAIVGNNLTILGTGTGDLHFGGGFGTSSLVVSRGAGQRTFFDAQTQFSGSTNFSGGDAFIRSSGTNTFRMFVGPSASLTFDGSADFALNSGASLNANGGSIHINAGRLRLNAGSTLTSGSSGVVNIAGGLLAVDGSVTLNANLLLSSGTLGGQASLYNYTGTSFQWTGGVIAGEAGSTVSITSAVLSGSAAKGIDTRAVTLSGSSAWNGGDIVLTNGGMLLANTMTVQSNGAITGPGQFVVFGAFRKTSSGTTTIASDLQLAQSNSSLQAASGKILLTAGGVSAGSIVTNAGTAVEFGGGTFELNNISNTGLGSFSGTAIGGNFLISGGRVNVNATGATINQNTALTVAGGTLGGSASNFTISGTSFQWTGGVITGDANSFVTVNAPALISGAATKTLDGRALGFSGTWSGGDFALTSGGALSTANLAALSNNSIAGDGSLTVFNSLVKDIATGTTTIAAPLSVMNNATVTANSGRILLTGGGTSAGSFVTKAGTTIEFGGGTFELNNMSNTGLGSFSGTAIGGNFLISGGRVNVNVSGATINQNTALALVSGGTLGGSAQSFTISGTSFQWTGGAIIGDMNSSVNVTAPAIVSGLATKTLDGRDLMLSGTWSGGDIALMNGAAISTSSLAALSNNSVTGAGNLIVFNSLVKDIATGTTTIAAPLSVSNNATVRANSGRILLTGGGTSAGSFVTKAGTSIEFGGGTFEFNNTSDTGFGSFIGPAIGGNFLISGGRVNVNANGAIVNQNTTLTLASGGTLGGSASNFTVAGTSFQWTGGVIAGEGNSAVTVAAPTLLSGTATKTVDSRLAHLSSGTWAGGDIDLGSSGTLSIGSLSVQTESSILGSEGGLLSISSEVRRTTSGTNSILAPISVQSSGSLVAANGRFILAGGGTAGGTFVTGDSGLIDFAEGVFHLTGNADLTKLSSATLGHFVVSGATLSVDTNAIINRNSILTITGGGLGGTGPNYTVSGTTLWQGGGISGSSGTTTISSVLISGPAAKVVDTRSVRVTGTWTGGDIEVKNGGVFDAADLINSSDVSVTGSTGTFAVSGGFTKNASSGTTAIAAPLSMSSGGSINVDAGRVLLTGGGVLQEGLLQTQAGSAIEFGGGNYQLEGGSTFGSYSGSTGGDFLITGGRVDIDTSDVSVNEGSRLTLTAGGTLGGNAQSYVISGSSFQWTGGVITGPAGSSVQAVTPTVIAGTATKTLDSRSLFINSGTWTGGDIAVDNATLGFGSLGIQSDNTITGSGLVAMGSVTKTSGAGTATIALPVWLSSGSLTAASGEILLTGGGTSMGFFQAVSSGTLTFGGGTFNLIGAQHFGNFTGTSGGTFVIRDAAVNLNGGAGTVNQDAALILASGGTLGGGVTSYLIAGRSFQWTGGAIAGQAGSHVSISAPAVISGAGTKTVDARNVFFYSGTWTGGDIAVNDATLGFSDLTIQSDGIITGSGTSSVDISGGLKNTTTGTTTIARPLVLGGTLTADSGRILLTGGGTSAGLFQTHASGAIELGGGLYNLSGNSVFGSFGGTPGGDFYLTGGRVNINGNTPTIGQNATLHLASGGTLGGTSSFYTIAGNSFQWTGGVITGQAGSSVSINAPAVLSGTGTKTVENRNIFLSSGTWTGGDIVVNNATLTLANLTIQSDGAITGSGTSPVNIFNALKNTATGTTTIARPLALSGTLTADSGRILLTGGGTSNGLFQTHAGGAIEFGGGTHDLSGNSALGSFGGETGGDFSITGGRLNINAFGATINQNANLILASGGTLGGTSSSYSIAGSSFQWTGGVITGQVGSSVSIITPAVLSGTATKTVENRSILFNSGTWTGGDIAVNNTMLALGNMTIQSDGAITGSGAPSVNISSALKNTTTGTTTIAIPLVNSGTLTADSGRILLTGGGTSNALFQTHAGGAIEFGGGLYDLSGSFALGSFGGETGGDFSITGGRVNINAGNAMINQNANLILASGTLGGTASNYVIAGSSFQWTGGVIAGQAGSNVFVSAPAVLSGAGTKIVNTRSVFFDSGTWTGGDITANNAALGFNSLTIQSDGAITGSGTSPVNISNALKNTATGTTTIARPLVLNGTLTADSGRILLTGGGTSAGLFQTHAGGAIEFGGGSYELSGNSALGSFGGETGGYFSITGGRLNVNAFGATINQNANLILAGGTLGGTASNYTIAGSSFQWSGGVITGQAGSGVIVNAPTLLLGPGTKTVENRNVFFNGGTWTGGNFVLNNATLHASGFVIQSDGVLSGTGGTFVTSGSLIKNTTTGTTTIATAYTNNGTVAVDSGVLLFSGTTTNSGTILIRDGGTLNAASYLAGSGSLEIAAGGTLMGSGTIQGGTTIAGGLAPGNSPGNLTFESSVVVADGGVYFMDLAALEDDATGVAGVDWDLITLAGNANLTFESGSALTIVFNDLTAPDPGNPFWQEDHSWLIADLAAGSLDVRGLHLTDDTFSAGVFRFDQVGNDLFLAFSVPEPGTAGLAVIGLALASLASSRCRRSGALK